MLSDRGEPPTGAGSATTATEASGLAPVRRCATIAGRSCGEKNTRGKG